jgi:hypothetical protein
VGGESPEEIMERRHVQFALIAFAIIFGSQLLQTWLFPRPPAKPGDGIPPIAGAKDALDDEQRPAPVGAALADAGDAAVGAAGEAPIAPADAPAPRTRHALGSVDPATPAQVLFTLTSRGTNAKLL